MYCCWCSSSKSECDINYVPQFLSVTSTVSFRLSNIPFVSFILSLWVADIPEISDDIIIKRTGVFQECFVQSTSFVIPRPKQSFSSKENDTSLCSTQNSELSIKWSACFPTTAVLLSNFGAFYTNDAFKVDTEIKVLSDILTQGLNNNVTVVALSDNGISFLINSTCYKREARHVFTLGAEHKLPESEILGMHSRCWCSTVCPVQVSYS